MAAPPELERGAAHLYPSFKELGGTNDSALHWDMVCDLREDGEVFADDELIWKAGRFIAA